MTDQNYPPQSAIKTGMRGLCPRCGEGLLFDGFLKPAKRCESCGLDLEFADSGDGPAIFIISIVGLIIVTLAMIAEALFHLPALVQFAIWIPMTILLSILMMRPFKGIMIALQYRHDAREGKID